MTNLDWLSFIPKIGDGLSWVTQKFVQNIAQLGLDITELQSKILLILILGLVIYLLFTVITFAKKLLKWILIGLAIFLAISVAISIFA